MPATVAHLHNPPLITLKIYMDGIFVQHGLAGPVTFSMDPVLAGRAIMLYKEKGERALREPIFFADLLAKTDHTSADVIEVHPDASYKPHLRVMA